MRLMFMRLVSELACDVLQFSPDSPFARFDHIRIQDGTSLQLKRSLAGVFPGRFTNTNPAAVELHVDLNLMSEMINRVALSPDSAAERPFLPAPEQVSGGLIRGDRGYFSKDYLQAVDHAGGFFIIRAKADVNPLIQRAIGPDGREVKAFRNQSLKSVSKRLSRYDCLDMVVCFATAEQAFECRLVIHPNLRTDGSPRYLATNLDADVFSTQHISDGYRLRWQIELLFKEWKSHANLRTFDTGNPHIAEGLVWAALCAATVKRYCAHMTQCISRVAMSTRTVAKCIHHVLSRVLYDLMHRPQQLQTSVDQAIDYLSRNARRAHPKRDQKTGRLKLGLIHVFADA